MEATSTRKSSCGERLGMKRHSVDRLTMHVTAYRLKFETITSSDVRNKNNLPWQQEFALTLLGL